MMCFSNRPSWWLTIIFISISILAGCSATPSSESEIEKRTQDLLANADRLNALGQYSSALTQYEQALVLAELKADDRSAIRIQYELGEAYAALEKWDEAYVAFSAVRLRSVETHTDYWIRSTIRLAELELHHNRYLQAKQFYEEAQAYLGHIQSEVLATETEISILNGLSIIHRRMDNPDKARDLLEFAYAKSIRANRPESISATAYNLAVFYARQGRWEEALELVEQALTIDKKAENIMGIYKDLQLLSRIYERVEDFDKKGIVDQRLKRIEAYLKGEEQ